MNCAYCGGLEYSCGCGMDKPDSLERVVSRRNRIRRCWRNGQWQADELANLAEAFVRELETAEDGMRWALMHLETNIDVDGNRMSESDAARTLRNHLAANNVLSDNLAKTNNANAVDKTT